jgi:two-component system CheB/CheR fusion protein
MLILDKDIRIKSANKSFCKTFHTKEEDCIGVSLFKLGNNQWNIPKLRNLLEDVVPKNSRIFEYEVESTFPIIGKKTMLLNAHRVHQKTKNEEIIVLTIVDITQVRKLAIELELKEKKVLKIKLDVEKKEKELLIKTSERFRHLLTGLPAGVYSCDEEGLISFYNDSAAKLWGRKPIIGKEYWCGAFKILNIDGNVIPLDESPMAIAFKEGRSITGKELIIEREDGTRSNVLVHPQPEFDLAGKVIGAINMVFDITEQMVIKNELINAKSIAEQKTLIAEDAVKAKQQFLSNMSHEIRTPMNAIIGFTNVLLKTELNNAQLEYINAIKTSGDALIFLINDILDIAKVDAGKMTFENTRFNLSESVALMLQLFDTKIQEKNIAFEKVFDKSIPQFVVGDPMRLRQIVLNLLSNAVKFTSSGKIMVNVNILNNTAEKIKIEFVVTDTGIGIKENRLENIFEDFEQATYENSRLYGGTGLGLSIVKKLVELQGGSISVKSKLGKGSTFSFILEFAIAKEIIVEANTKTIEASNYTNLTGKKINVLVAEDMALNQLLIKIILADFGFNIDIADNGKIAIEKVKTNTYDIILMDLQMPEINGFEATKYIRNELQNETPIIALTADVTTVDVDKCKASGMNDYISKPIDEKILYNKILSLVNHS